MRSAARLTHGGGSGLHLYLAPATGPQESSVARVDVTRQRTPGRPGPTVSGVGRRGVVGPGHAHLQRAVVCQRRRRAARVDGRGVGQCDPAIQREILDTAAVRGVIDREDATVRTTSHDYVSFEGDVVSKEGEFTCRRCSAEISTGYFIQFDAGDHGPFGSSCIRKVTGRED